MHCGQQDQYLAQSQSVKKSKVIAVGHNYSTVRFTDKSTLAKGPDRRGMSKMKKKRKSDTGQWQWPKPTTAIVWQLF